MGSLRHGENIRHGSRHGGFLSLVLTLDQELLTLVSIFYIPSRCPHMDQHVNVCHTLPWNQNGSGEWPLGRPCFFLYKQVVFNPRNDDYSRECGELMAQTVQKPSVDKLWDPFWCDETFKSGVVPAELVVLHP